MKAIDIDVAIVGGGTSGLSAAVAAAQAGAKVVVFEKSSTTGGTGNMAMGPFAVESWIQRLRKISITREEAFNIHMSFTHARVDARLVKAFIDKSASTISWLENMGVEFSDVHAHNPGFYFTWHTVKSGAGGTGPGAAAVMLKIMAETAMDLGVKILLNTPAKSIVREHGKIAGLIAEDKSGQEIKANAKAVIVNTGGFGDNPEWIKKYTGYDWGRDLFSIRIPGLVGDGLRMAWDLGAAPTDMTIHLTSGIANIAPFYTVFFTFLQPNLMVDIRGERIINEEFMQTTPFFGNIVTRQKNRCAFYIFDEDTKKYYQEKGLDFPPGVMAGYSIKTIDDFDSEMKQAIDQGKDVYIADSIEDIAAKFGINKPTLLQTINEYNKACESGRDELFHKNPRFLRPIKKAKFYAARLFPDGFGTLGGIKINYKTEVLNNDLEAIPGLYAAGVDANSINSDTYAFVLPGSTFGFAVNSGRIAGEEAAKYAAVAK
ncbi:MAG: hypothetical protein A2Z02_04330 [Chloroflexi bacterium RBG_16_48_7]|nr:MAG: hypothetical protein A2Z02_04330 [Chloroflexi bacterium RBG_16_48_7]